MIIEDYKKKYEMAFERAKIELNADTTQGTKNVLMTVFPELKESEDERIRKRLIEFFEDWGETKSHCWGKSVNKILAWLEKQGEQKASDTVEPKFKVGDWIVNNEDGSIGQITDIIYDESGYGYNHTNGWLHSVFEKDFHLWTIQDAKDGDVLVDDLGNICIYQEPSTKLMYHSYCYGKHKYFIDMGGSHEIVGTCPATKGQRDLLFQKMKEAGYQWNPDTKELKKVKQNPTWWSEEDEDFYNDIIKYFSDLDYPLSNDEDDVINWLKSLKTRLS